MLRRTAGLHDLKSLKMHFPPEWAYVFWAACVFAVIRAMHVIKACGDRHYAQPGVRASDPLFDVVHALVSRPTSHAWTYWNWFLEVFPIAAALGLVAATRGVTFPLMALLHGCILLMRAACFLCTLLPDASATPWKDARVSASGGVHDLMFSGHMAGSLMTTFLFRRVHVPTFWVLLVLCGVQAFGIVSCRKHYSVDVLVAWLVVPCFVEVALGFPALCAFIPN